MCDGCSELPTERVLHRHVLRKVLWKVLRIVDVPLELIDQSDPSNRYVQLDHDSHLVVLVLKVWPPGLHWSIVDEYVRVIVEYLLVHLSTHQLAQFPLAVDVVVWYFEILYEMLNEQLRRDELLV